VKPTAQRRRDRRALLDNLLGRALRGRLTVTEAALLTEQVREEQRAYDQTRRSLGETGEALGKHREAADAAIREAEQRAEQAEERLAAYVAVFGPHAVDDFHAMQHRAKRAEAALDRVRNAQRLGEALAAVAEYDGLTPEAARASAAFVEAADSTEARLAEQQREHEIALATLRKNLSESETLGHRLLQRAERAEYDAGRAAHDTRVYRGRLERLSAAHAEQAKALDAERCRAEQAEEQLAAAQRRGNGWRANALEVDHKAHRYRLAWLAARRDRKADRAAMAAEAPLVEAVERIRQYVDAAYAADMCEGVREDLRRLLDGKPPTYGAPWNPRPEVITDRAAIREALDRG
jgi:hypothetical protein